MNRRNFVQIAAAGGVRDYIRNIAPTPAAYRAIRQEAKKNGSSSLSMREINREIAAYRCQAKKSKKILMCVSEAVLAEYKEVLNRPRLKLTPRRIAGALAVIRKTSLMVKPTRTVSVIKADEPDNRLLECAEAAGADYLVTGNTKHFPKTFKNTAIVTPKQFMDLLLPQLAQS